MESVFKMTTTQLKKLPEEFLNSRCIVTTYFKQYGMGIGGANYHVHAYLDSNGRGWPYDAAAYTAAKNAGIKPYSKRGRRTAYGEIGAESFKRTVMTVREALSFHEPGRYGILGFEPLEAVNR